MKSLGGTFVNSNRLSPAGKESKPFKISHGDVLQFGVDYRPDARTGQGMKTALRWSIM
jgi:pSer/pThr/pTyr-binding forkhead associated (FHA) protein